MITALSMHAAHGLKQPLADPGISAGVLIDPLPGAGLRSELRAGAITIRRFRPEDADQVFTAIEESVSDLCSWMVWCRPNYSREECAAFISRCTSEWDSGQQFSYAIVDSRDGTFLGSVGLNCVNSAHRFANVGYWVRSSKTSRGIASTALRLISRLALESGGFERLEILVPVGNVPSQRVAEKSGAKQEGVLRHRIILNGKLHDALMFSLVKSDLM